MGLSLNNKIKKENAKMKFSQPKKQNKPNPRFYEIKDTINGFERWKRLEIILIKS